MLCEEGETTYDKDRRCCIGSSLVWLLCGMGLAAVMYWKLWIVDAQQVYSCGNSMPLCCVSPLQANNCTSEIHPTGPCNRAYPFLYCSEDCNSACPCTTNPVNESTSCITTPRLNYPDATHTLVPWVILVASLVMLLVTLWCVCAWVECCRTSLPVHNY